MKRREFIAGLGSAAAWPLAARAQQGDRVRRIGVLMSLDKNDPAGKPRLSAFTQALAELGWADGRNARMDLRWAGPDINRMRAFAKELVSLQPDIIVTIGSTARVETLPASPTTKPRWEASGLSCSQRSRPGSNGPQSCSIPTRNRLLCP